jgi:hypothetical protein
VAVSGRPSSRRRCAPRRQRARPVALEIQPPALPVDHEVADAPQRRAAAQCVLRHEAEEQGIVGRSSEQPPTERIGQRNIADQGPEVEKIVALSRSSALAERIQSEKRPRHSASDRHQHGFPAMIPPLHKENPQASSRILTRCAKGRKRARRLSASASSAARNIRPLS